MINKKKKWSSLNELKDYLITAQKENVVDFNGWRLEMEDAIYMMKYGELTITLKEIPKPEKKIKKSKK